MGVDNSGCAKPVTAGEPEQGLLADTRKDGRGAPKGNQNAEKHGFNTLKRSVLALGKRAIDGRSAVAKALKRWRLELINDLGGRDSISTQQHAIIDLAVKSKFLLDSIDAWLLTRDTLITGRKRAPAIIPVVIQRQQLADGLAKYLNMLGLERRHKVKTLQEILSQQDDEPPAPKPNGKHPSVNDEHEQG
jgi:hypothetical protein